MQTQTVLVVGGSGRTGQRVVAQLLSRGVQVRAIVRSADRLPSGLAKEPGLTVVVGDLLSLSDADLMANVRDCSAVVSCLGHSISLKGVFGPPRDLVTRAVTRLCMAIERCEPSVPVRLILMSSVSVTHPGDLDTQRGLLEKLVLWVLSGLVPPSKDNQRAANYLHSSISIGSPHIQWVAVRPDTLLEGEVSRYMLHESTVSSLFRPDSTNMANVAHFMCELATDSEVWETWSGKMPVIVNASTPDN